MKNNWFDVDKEGLSKILDRKGGKSFAIFELIQNAWDENISRLSVSLTPIENRAACKLVAIDDSPEGFSDISHAFTLFAESKKKTNPSQRGRFNLGEKLVLACCEEAKIVTTKGTVHFTSKGERLSQRKGRPIGSKFEGIIRMTRVEYKDACEQITSLIAPKNIITTFNGQILKPREPLASFDVSLPTEIADEEGRLKKTKRITSVQVYKVLPGETASIYEMGIPVVETGDKFHVDIQQKVPVNLDRDNVPPSYLRDVRTFVLNHTYKLLEDEEDLTASWVNNALEDERCDTDAIDKVITGRFGEDAVAYDPSDPEGSKISMSQGRPVIYGSTFNKSQWSNIRKTKNLPAAGQVTPSPKPFSPDGTPLSYIPEDKWTEKMHRVAKLCKDLANELMDVSLDVKITSKIDWPYLAVYGDKSLIFNKGKVGKAFFEDFPNNFNEVTRLIIHEFGHEYADDHLSSKYHDALCKLGAKMTKLALEKPEIFK